MSRFRRVAMVAAFCLLTCYPALAQEPQSTLPLSVPDTILVIRVKNMNQTIQAVLDTAASFNPAFVGTIQEGIDEMKQELAGVDFDGPVAILILDPEKSDEPLGVFTLSDPAAFEQNQQPNTVTKAMGKLGFICNDAQLIDEAIAVFKANNLTAVPTGDMKDMVVMDANVSELITRYKSEIKAGLEEARSEVQEPDDEEAVEKAALTETQTMALKAMDYLEKLINELERQGGPMQMGLSFNPQEMVVNFDAAAAAGSPAAQFFAENNLPVNKVLAKYLPQDAYLSSISAFNPDSQARMMDGMVNIAADIFELDAAESAAMHKAVADYVAALTGLYGSADIASGTNATSAGVRIFGITSRDAARKSFSSMIELTKGGKLGKVMSDYGLSVNFAERHRDSSGIPVDKIEMFMDIDKLAGALDIPEDARETLKESLSEMFRKTYGTENGVAMEIAYGRKLAAVVYGGELEKRMDEQIALLKSGTGGLLDLPEYQAALANQPEQASGLVHFSLFRFNDMLAQLLAEAGGAMMMDPTRMLPTRAELPPNDQPMSLGVVFNENKMSVKFRMPMQPVRDYVAVVQRKYMQMMQEMMQGGGQGMPPMPPQDFEGEELDDF